jgi:hypothetical protein
MKTLIILIFLSTALVAVVTNSETAKVTRAQERLTQNTSTPAPAPPIKVTINTAKNALNSVTDRFHVGDQILVPITMTNTSTSPVVVCDSADIYQDLPTLTNNGAIVPIMDWQSRVERILRHDQTCERLNVPEPINLNPSDPKLVDWLVLVDSKVSTGSDAWYDSLPPGKYELSLQRRVACCDGPKVRSNKINFEVLP